MNLAGTGHTSHAGATAEAEVLIEEARARARRRRRRIAVVVVCAAVLAAGTMAAAVGLSSGRPTAGARNRAGGAVAGLASAPRYFIDATQSDGSAYGWLEIRESATGKLVANPRQPVIPMAGAYLPPYGLAATGPRSFVVGMMTPSDCATRFFRMQLDDQGRPGALTPVGPTLPGTLSAMAASAGGGLIGYAIDDSGCHKGGGSPGAYLGVLDVRSGRTRQWTDAFSDLSQLSMSANGRLLAFTHETGVPAQGGGLMITGTQVRVLSTDAAPGTVAERSRVVARTPANFSAFSGTSVLLSPSGTSFYLCSQPFTLARPGARQIVENARIIAYRTATGKATGVVATFSGSIIPSSKGGGFYLTLGCSTMALDASGRFLLVPYMEAPVNQDDPYSAGVVRAAVINTSTGAKSAWTLQFGQGGAPSQMTVAW
jgi:hypothetical protein